MKCKKYSVFKVLSVLKEKNSSKVKIFLEFLKENKRKNWKSEERKKERPKIKW